MASKTDFDALFQWLGATDPKDSGRRRAIIAGVVLNLPDGQGPVAEWAGELGYDPRQVRTVKGKFIGDLATINNPAGTHIEFALALADNNAWIGASGGGLTGAWREDVPIASVTASVIPATNTDPPRPRVTFEATTPWGPEYGDDKYLAVDMNGGYA